MNTPFFFSKSCANLYSYKSSSKKKIESKHTKTYKKNEKKIVFSINLHKHTKLIQIRVAKVTRYSEFESHLAMDVCESPGPREYEYDVLRVLGNGFIKRIQGT